MKMFDKVLVANRGEIACRIITTLKRIGVLSVAVYSDADRGSLHVDLADEAYRIGEAAVKDSYLNQDAILAVAQKTQTQAIHPGYGLLSENADFAQRCVDLGVTFIGPKPEHIRCFGLKDVARNLAKTLHVPLLDGSDLLESIEQATVEASKLTYPVMLKSSAGGGGIGMHVCDSKEDLFEAFDRVQRLSQTHFGAGGIFLEKYIETARHVEVQIFGDGCGKVISLGLRDCSAQRRRQKVVEEAPAPGLSQKLQEQLQEAAKKLCSAVNYSSAGTVEFLVDVKTNLFYFLEVNTRLQVEHGVTEAIYGGRSKLDLIEWMIRLSAGQLFVEDLGSSRGHSIEARICAEQVYKNYQPSSGVLSHVVLPNDNVQVDTWIRPGADITTYYDSLLAKFISYGETREIALDRLLEALRVTQIYGVETNIDYLLQILDSEAFRQGNLSTTMLADIVPKSSAVEVIEPGRLTTIQSYPGRLGYWAYGIPPSGPMDDLSLRRANHILGNELQSAALEFTETGAKLKFRADTYICLVGAHIPAFIDGSEIAYNYPVFIEAESILSMGSVEGPGQRTYLAIAGGFHVPEYLGSTTTFALGQFGGHCGRALRSSDVLYYSEVQTHGAFEDSWDFPGMPLCHEWEIGVLLGPHAAPDFFLEEDIKTFFEVSWKVHYNSARTGIRLLGPKPTWARQDGGEAGLHPSNIHDNAYSFGAVDFTGDTPVILGPDGPSLGGFVCPAVVVTSELWKLGQLRPGDTLKFVCITTQQADIARKSQQDDLFNTSVLKPCDYTSLSAVLAQVEDRSSESKPSMTIRRSGDAFLLVEFGEIVLDFSLRLRAGLLSEALVEQSIEGIIDLTPGIRSLQIHFDPQIVQVSELIDKVILIEEKLPAASDMEIKSRIVYLPLSWNDPSTQLATDRYMKAVRADAPWCPNNIEFIRRINGLDSIEDVRKIVFDASYLVLGLGDVYLGAPVATPLDPCHRLVTTKYNPARTWTPENAVGIGGAYMCIYGMEGPGGYQFVGRTIPVFNKYRSTKYFEPSKPWLLRFFDQIRYFPVEPEELLDIREDLRLGRYELSIEDTVFNLGQYQKELSERANEIELFKLRQRAAFDAERQRWKEQGEFDRDDLGPQSPVVEKLDIPAAAVVIKAPMGGSVWKVEAQVGQLVDEETPVVILESMKMEIAIKADNAGIVCACFCSPGQVVEPGTPLMAIK